MWNGGWIDTLSLNNVRDLGGMPAQDGRHIRYNRLIRGGLLSGATEEDISILRGHDVRVIIDLRGDPEIAGAPDPVLEGVRYIKNPLFPARTSGITHEEEMAQTARKMSEGYNHMKDLYGRAARNDRAVFRLKQFFGYLLNQKEGAVLWHCAAGKDRTGITAALVETALGVPRDIVMQDYLYTNDFSKKAFSETMARILIKTDDQTVVDSAREMMLAREEYLQAFVTGMILEEGSIEQYMEKRLGLDEKTKAQLQDMYLE